MSYKRMLRTEMWAKCNMRRKRAKSSTDPGHVAKLEQRRKLLHDVIDDGAQLDDVNLTLVGHRDVTQVHVLRLVESVQQRHELRRSE